ncbi:MAG: DUF4129 domain-containing protein [Actinobacteria bacterium]|nr:MAG: DUF4129 domain-containing protein [Actinomycetota bacterium]
MANDDRRRALPSELGVAALVVAASIPLGRLFRTGNVVATCVAAAAVSTTIAWALRRLHAPALLSVLGSLAAFLWFASLAFFRGAMFGPFPTPHALALIWHASGEAIRRSQTDVAPVAATPAFLCLTSFAVWATAWLADDAAIKLRHPMLAIGVTIPLYVLPGTILSGDHRTLDAGLYLAAALWVLFSDERFRLSRWGRVVGRGVPGWRPGLAARMGLLAIVLALVATPVLPGFGAPPRLRGVSGSGTRSTLNPLVSIRPQLGRRDPIEVFTVRSRGTAYWRLTALDRFDGLSWTSAPQRPTLRVSGRSVLPESEASTVRVVQEFDIRGLGGPWLPAVYEPVRVDGLRGAAEDPVTRTLISPTDLRRGMHYRVESRAPLLTFEKLDLAPATTDPAFNPYVQMPPGRQTLRIGQISRQVVAKAHATKASPFRQAVALQNYLRTFTYDENVLLTHTIDDIVDFLTQDQTGYCEQFATAMAAMARTLGLPSRVAIGFAGGTPGPATDEFVVTSRNAHAWVEIWFDGFGWVQFEPTPRADSVVVPAYTSPTNVSPTPTVTPSNDATAEPTVSPSTKASDVAEPTPGAETPRAGGSGRGIMVASVALSGLVLLLVIAFPVTAFARRALRRSRAHTTRERVAVRYLDFLDWCAASGLGRIAGETPLEHARRLADASSGGAEAVAELASLAVDAVYAPGDGIDDAAAAVLARGARMGVASTLSRRDRILRRLGWAWWRADPASHRSLRERLAEPAR